MKNITFTTKYDIQPEFYPKPAASNLPEWLVKMASYGGYMDMPEGVKGVTGYNETNATIKKCVPVNDAASAGYILFTHSDIWVERGQFETDPIYRTRGPLGLSNHDSGQAKNHPVARPNVAIPKMNNPWMVKTPAGYSSLFTAPMHNSNGIFTCLPGIVDTDTYFQEVNLPFTFDNPKFSGLIPAGTPMIQVIPFKRDDWEMRIGGKKEIDEANKLGRRHTSRLFNVYRSLFWSRKEFK